MCLVDGSGCSMEGGVTGTNAGCGDGCKCHLYANWTVPLNCSQFIGSEPPYPWPQASSVAKLY
jgi:hypothetical protein